MIWKRRNDNEENSYSDSLSNSRANYKIIFFKYNFNFINPYEKNQTIILYENLY